MTKRLAILLFGLLAGGVGCASQPMRPPETPNALAADLVELTTLDPTLRLDIRYATSNDFLGFPLYREPRAFLQRPVARELMEVNKELREQGYELIIFDAYRPWSVTKTMWERAKPEWRAGGYVADPRKGSRHNRGTTVDLTIATIGGDAVEMPTGYDSFEAQAHADATDITPTARANRERLRTAMARHDFAMLPEEWWHFDHASWPRYPILDVPFEQIATQP